MSKNYVNGIFIKEFEFNNGGSILKTTITRKGLQDLLQSMKPDQEKMKIVIAKRKSKDQYDNTHYAYYDDYKKQIEDHKEKVENGSDDIPF